MADVRALLKAKREEQRISHPYATYTSTGQLRCIACDMSVKHASAWNGHVGSKAHRTNVARLKEERVREEQAKRKAEELEEADEAVGSKKQKLDDVEENNGDDDDDERNIYANANGVRQGVPADFFSDPRRTLPIFGRDSDDEEEQANTLPASAQQPQQPPSEIDLEWAKFQETVISSSQTAEEERERFAHATIAAEPELVSSVPEGFPSSVIQGGTDASVLAEPEAPKDDAEERKRKEEEEKETIMDRLLEEERAQEEADERVSVLKARLEIVKRRRILAKTQKAKNIK